MKIFCVKCKEKTETVDMIQSFSKKNQPMIKGKCLNCNCKKNVFIKKDHSNSPLSVTSRQPSTDIM